MKRLKAAAVITALLLTAINPAFGSDGTDEQRFVAVSGGGSDASIKVSASGLVSGVGTEQPVEFEEGPDGTFVDKALFVFDEGSVYVTRYGRFEMSVDQRSCIITVSSTGTFEITGGTGAFDGITGGGSDRFQGRAAAPKTDDGCSWDDLKGYFIARLTGTAALPAQEA